MSINPCIYPIIAHTMRMAGWPGHACRSWMSHRKKARPPELTALQPPAKARSQPRCSPGLGSEPGWAHRIPFCSQGPAPVAHPASAPRGVPSPQSVGSTLSPSWVTWVLPTPHPDEEAERGGGSSRPRPRAVPRLGGAGRPCQAPPARSRGGGGAAALCCITARAPPPSILPKKHTRMPPPTRSSPPPETPGPRAPSGLT